MIIVIMAVDSESQLEIGVVIGTGGKCRGCDSGKCCLIDITVDL